MTREASHFIVSESRIEFCALNIWVRRYREGKSHIFHSCATSYYRHSLT